MADGYNDARAMRVAEIMADFRNLQYYISQIQVNPPPEDYYLEGYTLLRACVAEARAILASPYAYGTAEHPQGEPEAEKSQLQAYVLPLPRRWDGTSLSVYNILKRERIHIKRGAVRDCAVVGIRKRRLLYQAQWR